MQSAACVQRQRRAGSLRRQQLVQGMRQHRPAPTLGLVPQRQPAQHAVGVCRRGDDADGGRLMRLGPDAGRGQCDGGPAVGGRRQWRQPCRRRQGHRRSAEMAQAGGGQHHRRAGPRQRARQRRVAGLGIDQQQVQSHRARAQGAKVLDGQCVDIALVGPGAELRLQRGQRRVVDIEHQHAGGGLVGRQQAQLGVQQGPRPALVQRRQQHQQTHGQSRQGAPARARLAALGHSSSNSGRNQSQPYPPGTSTTCGWP